MRVLIAAGGTAGHINPALAIASCIKENYPDAQIHFAGRKDGMEYKLVIKAGYPFHHIEVNGIQRSLTIKNIYRNVKALWYLALSGTKAKKIITDFKPDLVIGTGGYVSGPVVRAAAHMGVKTAIHEQNALPGVTNKLLAKDVDVVFTAVEAAKEKLGEQQKTIVCGNPVRQAIANQDRASARKKLGLNDDEIMLLSFGGSLGARRINQVVADLCEWHLTNRKFKHIHATGSYGVQLFKELSVEKAYYGNANLDVKEFIDDMATCLAAADLVICRAGALTLAEIAVQGKASILIPSPNVAENHQYFNALEFEKVGAAKVIEEKDLTGEKLIETVDQLTKDKVALAQMGENAKKCATKDSLDIIFDNIKGFLQDK